jgi:formylglycine-generating enzyme required for sulfatase activity
MARYPVTNAQYQAFIDAGGYRSARQSLLKTVNNLWQGDDWWRGLKRPEPETSRWLQANRPRTNVDWYEAVAFSRWLSKQLGYEVRLPNELEWERAARGRDGWQYPWGNAYESGRANIDETWGNDRVGEWNLGQTTAVGVYRHGASSEGVLDLSGNVWEWCLNQYEHPEQIQADTSGQVARAARWLVEQLPGPRARLATPHVPPWQPEQRRGFSLGVVCPHSVTRCSLPTAA